jgi:hypothetical protein
MEISVSLLLFCEKTAEGVHKRSPNPFCKAQTYRPPSIKSMVRTFLEIDL